MGVLYAGTQYSYRSLATGSGPTLSLSSRLGTWVITSSVSCLSYGLSETEVLVSFPLCPVVPGGPSTV